MSEPWPWIVGLLVGVFIVIYEHLTDSKIFFKVFAFVAFIGALIVEGPMWGRAILILMALGAFLAESDGRELMGLFGGGVDKEAVRMAKALKEGRDGRE